MKPHVLKTCASLLAAAIFIGACSGPSEDTVLPTLARLPSLTPSPTLSVKPTQAVTPTPEELALPAADVTSAPPLVPLPGPLDITPTVEISGEAVLDAFPETLTAGSVLTLMGTLTTNDVNSGTAVLTNEAGQQMSLLIDPFSAMTANNQVVQVTGMVVEQADAIQVTAILMVNGASSIATPTEPALPE